MKDLVQLERERNIRPSPEIDAFMKVIAETFYSSMPTLFVCKSNLVFFIRQASASGNKLTTDYVLKVLGLDVCSETVVGSDMLRGVSGGQRKRVTTGLFLLYLLCASLQFLNIDK